MFSMTKLRDNSKVMMGILLFFFVASMTVGGLVGGANILTTIQGIFGKVNTTLYVGKVGDEEVPISYYINERQQQINRFRQQGRSIDSRAIQNAGDFAWNNIVDRFIKDKKIEEFNLSVSNDEIFDFLLLTPPVSFQNNLKTLGLYTDGENNFLIEDYQNDIRFGTLPDTTNQILLIWENYLREFLADRKLQNLFNNSASISNNEVLNEYKKNNLSCNIDYLSINYNNINDSLINISDDELLKIYEEDKDQKYMIDEKVTLEYILWENISDSDLDSLEIIEEQDSLLQTAIDFASEAEITSFTEALKLYELNVTDTIQVTENFKNNSGIPFQMGAVRAAVRFAFDNSNGSSSNYMVTDNGIAVFHILEKTSNSYDDFNNVKSNIKRSIIGDKKKEYAKDILKNFSDDWKAAAKNNIFVDLNENETGTWGQNFPTIGRSNDLLGSLLGSSTKGKIDNILESSSHVFLANIYTIDNMEEDLFNSMKDSIETSLLTNKRNQVYNNWLRAEKKNLDIIDLRHKIF